MVRVKICGITNAADALTAVEAGADALGFVFYEESPRSVTPETAADIIRGLPPFVSTVGLFVNADIGFVNAVSEKCRLDRVQLHGDESPDFCRRVERPVVKVIRIRGEESLLAMKDYHVSAFLLDAYSPRAYGGTGLTFNWELARNAKKFGPMILAGGLTAANVREGVVQVQPYAVDVSSGVEASPGRKDPAKVKEFIKRAKGFVEDQ
ncbi:MAG: N-(5-phosphoribosyl)anthranilate isomerase [Geobacteraceae bacterium]|jgi:phosphoribosylanthranilate isomerase|nr:N-(5-phosphoribosyl)anthranilate isomerase [Geobacteraceae bacterium]